MPKPDLKEGDEVDLHLVDARSFEVTKKPSITELLARLHQFRGRLPPDFHFDRLERSRVVSKPFIDSSIVLYLLSGDTAKAD